MGVELSSNKYYKEYKDRLNSEMLKFKGKVQGVADGLESASDLTTDTKLSRKKPNIKQPGAQPGVNKQTTFGGVNQVHPKDEEVDDLIAMMNNKPGGRRGSIISDQSINQRDTGFNTMKG